MAIQASDITDIRKKYVTPKGELEPYAYLNKPDFGRDHFVNERGTYKCSLTFSLDDPKTVALMDFIDEVYNKNWEMRLADHEDNPPPRVRGKKVLEPYKGDLPYTDNGDGTVTFSFSAWASFIKDGKKQDIRMTYADSRGRPLKADQVPAIWSGSILRASFKVLPYGWSNVAGASVKLQLHGVMLIDVISGSGGADEFAEFAEEDGGFEAGDYVAADSRGNHEDEEQDDQAPWEGEDEGGEPELGTGDY